MSISYPGENPEDNGGHCAIRFTDGFMLLEVPKILFLGSLLNINSTDPVIVHDAVLSKSGSRLRLLLSMLKPITRLTATTQPCSWNMLLRRR